ncbi:MAG: DUF2520 domain-containing protein [Tatlockia sp.]|nr:DUF2520 domain-containing protein [Tatlockia sp.]
MTYLVNIIGAGNVGKTIGHLLVKNGIAKIGAVQSTTEENARKAIDFIGEGKFFQDLNNLPQADITFITTPDDHISETCLKYSNYFKPGSIIIHCSGSLTSDILSSAKKKDCSIISVHPMRSFAKPDMSVLQYNGTFCAIEGDANIMSVISALFESFGSITYTINKEKKAFYHTAGVFASNYLVTLSKQASLCMKEAGVEDEMAMKIITSIMKGTVNNLEKTLSPEQSLTGPIQRGDISTIKNHMTALANNSEQSELYSVLGKATLKVANHGEHKRKAIEKTLTREDITEQSQNFFQAKL